MCAWITRPSQHLQPRTSPGQVETRHQALFLADECPGLELEKRADRREHRSGFAAASEPYAVRAGAALSPFT